MTTNPAIVSNATDTVKIITSYLAPELGEVQRLLRETIDSESSTICEVGEFLGLTTGKKLRPAMNLLFARAFAPQKPAPVEIATALELIHVATLIHDDVIDRADTRRGRASVNAKWGDDVAILMADFLYARAFDLALTSLRPEFLKLICGVTQRMCEGEMFQIEMRDRAMTPEDYLHVVERKTGQLFSACAALGAMTSGRGDDEIRAASEYGRAFGIAFQITDDTLDFVASDDRWGKEIGMDVSGGKQTLPLLLAMAEAEDADRQELSKHWNNGRNIESIVNIVQRLNGVDRSIEYARNFTQRAIDQLDRLKFTDDEAAGHLAALPEFVLQRVY